MKRAALLFCLILFSALNTFGQTISLEQVRVLALANSRSLAKTDLAVQSAALEERARIFSNLPSLSAGASASMSLWSAADAP